MSYGNSSKFTQKAEPARKRPPEPQANPSLPRAPGNVVCLAFTALLHISCDVWRPAPPTAHGPDITLTGVRAIFPEGATAELTSEAVDVPVGSTLAIAFDRFVHPTGVSRQSLCLQASLLTPETIEECTPLVPLEPQYFPSHREIRVALPENLPRSGILQLTVLPPHDDSPLFGVRAFDGAPLAEPGVVRFRVVDAPGPPNDADGAPPEPDLCERAATLLNASCASCHAGNTAPMNLVLSPLAPLSLGRVSRQTERGTQAGAEERFSLPLGNNLPIIAAGDPGRSYLVYKMLVDPRGAWHEGIASGELERLQNAFVRGMAMPQHSSAPLEKEDLADIEHWIMRGASSTCTP